MNKDVWKRVIASILVICMIGTTPDLSAFAREISATGAEHAYANDMSSGISYESMADGEWIANTFAVQSNASDTMNAQILKKVSFALDAKLHNGDITRYVKEADFTVEVYKYQGSALDAINGGQPDATVTGRYSSQDLGADDFFTVDFEDAANTVTYKEVGETFLPLADSDNFAVKVSISNSVVIDSADVIQPSGTAFFAKTAQNADALSYKDNNVLQGKTVCIKAQTVEAAVEYPVTGINFLDSGFGLKIGETKTIRVEYQPVHTSQKLLDWETESSAVATVDADGTVTAVGLGSVDIIAKSRDNPAISARTTITVCKDIANIPDFTIADQTYTGKPNRPSFAVWDGAAKLEENTHYRLRYGNNDGVGTDAGSVTIEGLGTDYLGEKLVKFNILPANMSNSMMSARVKPGVIFEYDGVDPVQPTGADIEVRYGTSTDYVVLEENIDYKIKEYQNNTSAGNSAYMVLEGMGGKYVSIMNCYFEIKKAIDSPSIEVTLDPAYFTYTGVVQKPSVIVKDTENPNNIITLRPDRDYKLIWDSSVDYKAAGTKTVRVQGVGAYETFEADGITPKTLPADYLVHQRTMGNVSVNPDPIPNQIVGATGVSGVTLTYNGMTLVEGADKDYTVERVDNVAAGTTTITFKANPGGNYKGDITRTAPMGIDISGADVILNGSLTYTGEPVKPTVDLILNGSLLTDPENCFEIVEYGYNTNARKDTDVNAPFVKIKGIGAYAGDITHKFTIEKKDISTLGQDAFIYDEYVEYKKPLAPATGVENTLTIKYGQKTLVKPEDYLMTYSGNLGFTTPDTPATITVSGQGNYKGQYILEYQINKKNVDSEGIIISGIAEKYTYTGAQIRPANISVKQYNIPLVENTDYEVEYGANLDAGANKGFVRIRGKNNSNYMGTKTIYFNIEKFDISLVNISTAATPGITPKDYTGTEIKPFDLSVGAPTVKMPVSGTVLVKDNGDFTVEYENNIEAGTATAVLSGGGNNFTGEKRASFIVVKDLSNLPDDSVTIDNILPQGYTGEQVKPLPKVTDQLLSLPDSTFPMREGFEYKLSYTGNVAVGRNATVIVTGEGDYYKGSMTKTFQIVKGNLEDPGIDASLEDIDLTFTGSPIEPAVTIKYNGVAMVENIDYTVDYRNCTDVSDVSLAVITGVNLEGDLSLPIDIKPREIKEPNLTIASIPSQPYTGSAMEPRPVITDPQRTPAGAAGVGGYVLKSGDFRAKYEKNIDVTAPGESAEVWIEGRGNYYTSNKIKKTFEISSTALTTSNTTVTLSTTSYTYTGLPITPIPKVVYTDANGVAKTLRPNTDFKVLVNPDAINVAANIAFGIEGAGNYTGTLSNSGTFEIIQKEISDRDIVIAKIPNQGYTGAPITPELKITYREPLRNGIEYDITGSGNNTLTDTDDTPEADQPTITITGKGNFKGSRNIKFHIRKNIQGATITGMGNSSFVYTSEPIEPVPTVILDGITLVPTTADEPGDYELVYKNNVDAKTNRGTPSLEITGDGMYGGTYTVPFEITRVNMSRNSNIHYEITNPEFTGSQVKPEIKITYTPTPEITYTLLEGRGFDYTIGTITNTGNTGQVSILPAGSRGNFDAPPDGTIVKTFGIGARNITDNQDIEIAAIPDQTFTGTPVTPNIVVKDKKRADNGAYQPAGSFYYTMRPADYDVNITGNDKPGEAKVVIKGKGNYTGEKEAKFTILGAFRDAEIELGRVVYTGERVKPSISVTYNNGTIPLRPGTDYKYEFFENINCSDDSYALVTGMGSYAGAVQRKPFDIEQKDINSTDVRLLNILPSYTYMEGKVQEPSPILIYGRMKLEDPKDYTCSYNHYSGDSTSIGKHTITITTTENGNYKGAPIVRDYEVGNNFKVKLDLPAQSYTYAREDIKPEVTVTELSTNKKLEYDIDYGVEYQKNDVVGTADVWVYGKGQYKGDAYTQFEINPKSLGDDDIQMAAIDSTAYTYSGEPITPEPVVEWKGKALTSDDITYVHSGNINAGNNATVTIIPVPGSNYSDSKEKTFVINKKNISAEDSGITVSEIDPQPYDDAGVWPLPEVKWGEKTLENETDYTLSYDKNKAVGKDATVTVVGKTNYEGRVVRKFEITKVSIASMEAGYETEWEYTGSQITPPVTVSYLNSNQQKVTLDKANYDVIYGENNINAGLGAGKITIKAKGDNYVDELNEAFDIVPRSLKDSSITIAAIGSQVIEDGKAEPKPEITFTYAGKKYKLIGDNDKDYSVSYANSTAVGQYGNLTITGNGNFTDTLDPIEYYIGDDIRPHITDQKFENGAQYVYNGQEQKPKVIFNSDLPNITEGTEYEIIYDQDCISAGEHKAVINGLPPYGGSVELKYNIDKRDIKNAEFEIQNQTFTGSSIHPLIVGVDQGALTILGEDPSTSGTNGNENIDQDGMTTNANAFTTNITNNLKPGRAEVSITAADESNYFGTTKTYFTIEPQNISASVITSTNLEQLYEYTGSDIMPEVVLTDTRRNTDGTAKTPLNSGSDYKLVKDQDYTISYQENRYPGTATLTINGIGSYGDFIGKMFQITADLSMASIAAIPDQDYAGGALIEPLLTVRLGERTLRAEFDYKVRYSGNTDRGTATATIIPMPGSLYTGSKSVNFNINGEISQATVTLLQNSFTYTGGAISPQVGVTYDNQVLDPGQHYTVVYNNNVNVGMASLTVVGIGSFTGNITKTFNIVPKSIIRCDFSEAISRLYTGTPTNQSLFVKDAGNALVENRDYTIRYVNNTNPGTATVTITGMGNYGGAKTIRYVIDVPDMPEIRAKASTTSIKISWSPVSGATGYEIYDTKNKLIAKTSSTSYTKKKLKSMKTYTYKVRPYVTSDGNTNRGGFSNTLSVVTTPSKPSVKVKAGSKSIKISWKKIRSVSGYEVYSSTSKKGKYKRIKTIKKSSTISYTNKKLKSKKTYYYKVRAYKTVSGKKVYSSYSSIKSTRAK